MTQTKPQTQTTVRIEQQPSKIKQANVVISNNKGITRTCKLILPSCVTTLTYQGK